MVRTRLKMHFSCTFVKYKMQQMQWDTDKLKIWKKITIMATVQVGLLLIWN